MICRINRILPILGLAILTSASFTFATDECSRTAQMKIYSSAIVHKETGDVLGYELALAVSHDATVSALLYVYEGAPNDEAIPLSGHMSGTRLSIEGNWVEHLTEYPSKKQMVQTHFVKVDGMLDSASFRGNVTIGGIVERDSLRLRRVKKTWLCKTKL